jgi:hypothetical protein
MAVCRIPAKGHTVQVCFARFRPGLYGVINVIVKSSADHAEEALGLRAVEFGKFAYTLGFEALELCSTSMVEREVPNPFSKKKKKKKGQEKNCSCRLGVRR